MKTPQEEAFLADLKAVCEKHGMVLVPTFEYKSSAHDPMVIVKFDDFWKKFITDRVLGEAHQDEIGAS